MSCEYCNNCKHAKCHVIKSDIYDERKNWYCGYNTHKVLLDLTCEKDALIEVPNWCPLSFKTQVTTKESTIKIDIREKLKSIKTITKWEDIEVNKIYHLPPLMTGDKRKDILITSKSQYSISYKILNGNANYQINTFYPSSIEVKFLVPHKIMKFELINNGVR